MSKPKNEDQYSEQEAQRRRDAVVKHMLSTPPKPHAEMKVGKPRRAASSAAPAKPKKHGPAA